MTLYYAGLSNIRLVGDRTTDFLIIDLAPARGQLEMQHETLIDRRA